MVNPLGDFQVFQRVPCGSPVSQDDARFEYFVGTVLPQLVRAKQAHTAVFIPSYFDYVRVRNHLMKTRVSVVNVHEYSRGSEVREKIVLATRTSACCMATAFAVTCVKCTLNEACQKL